MKRDLDLIRLLLIQVENGETPSQMSRYTETEILYHTALTIEADLLIGVVHHELSGEIVAATLQRLSWAGHDFLDASRNDKHWEKMKKKILNSGGSWTFDIVKSLLTEIAKKALLD